MPILHRAGRLPFPGIIRTRKEIHILRMNDKLIPLVRDFVIKGTRKLIKKILFSFFRSEQSRSGKELNFLDFIAGSQNQIHTLGVPLGDICKGYRSLNWY